MNIDDLTIGQVKQLTGMLSGQNSEGLTHHLNSKVIVRTYSAGVWFGELIQKSGTEVILKDARRLWRWQAKKSISLSAVAVHGIDQSNSKVCPAVDRQWLDAIEIISMTDEAIQTIEGVADVEAS